MRNIARLIGTGMIGASLVGLVVPAASANEKTGHALDRAQVGSFPGESFSQYYGGRRGYYGGGRGYRYGRRGYGGGAVAAGVIGGLAVGALAGAAIAGSQPAPAYGGPGYGGPGQPVGNVYGHDPRWVNYCASRYRSFDPASGTYLAGDGNRYVCQ